jgi:hypothetical protein
MVEDRGVEVATIHFRTALDNFEKQPLSDLRRQSNCLARAIKSSISSNWTIDFRQNLLTSLLPSTTKVAVDICDVFPDAL